MNLNEEERKIAQLAKTAATALVNLRIAMEGADLYKTTAGMGALQKYLQFFRTAYNTLINIGDREVPALKMAGKNEFIAKAKIGDNVMITDNSSLLKGLAGIIVGVDGNFWVVKTVRGQGMVSRFGIEEIQNF